MLHFHTAIPGASRDRAPFPDLRCAYTVYSTSSRARVDGHVDGHEVLCVFSNGDIDGSDGEFATATCSAMVHFDTCGLKTVLLASPFMAPLGSLK